MKLETNDFVWIWNGEESVIDWGVVIGDKIVLQMGGFEEVKDFDENLVYKYDYNYYIGGIVKNAASFASARAFYEHWANGNGRFINHHTDMKVIPFRNDCETKMDKEAYLKTVNSTRRFTVEELQSIFGQNICIGAI